MATTWAGAPAVVRSKAVHPVADTPPGTPSEMGASAHQLVSQLRWTLERLSALESLAPGEEINALLTDLVNLCITPYTAEFTTYVLGIDGVPSLCEQLRPICATAEGELERYWARRILQDASRENPLPTRDLLHSFPYYQNYLDLSRLECCTVEAFLPSTPHSIAFIGSGPLPLTSLCVLDRYPEAAVHNIDRDADALQASQELSSKLGYGARMSFSLEDVSDDSTERKTGAHTSKWKAFDVVFLAALVGTDTETKLDILQSLGRKLQPGTLVVARSARGLRSVLYPILELSQDLERIGFEVLVEVHPWSKVVNSVIVLKVLG